MAPMQIALVGTGLGGVAFAAVLRKELEKHGNQNVKLTIYEAAPEFTITGAAICLGTNAESVLNYLDLAKECRSHESVPMCYADSHCKVKELGTKILSMQYHWIEDSLEDVKTIAPDDAFITKSTFHR